MRAHHVSTARTPSGPNGDPGGKGDSGPFAAASVTVKAPRWNATDRKVNFRPQPDGMKRRMNELLQMGRRPLDHRQRGECPGQRPDHGRERRREERRAGDGMGAPARADRAGPPSDRRRRAGRPRNVGTLTRDGSGGPGPHRAQRDASRIGRFRRAGLHFRHRMTGERRASRPVPRRRFPPPDRRTPPRSARKSEKSLGSAGYAAIVA